MSIAEALLFGFFFFGIIYLYTKTKNTWNWKKIIKNALIGTAFIFTSIAAIFFGFEYYNNHEDIHTPATTLEGIRLGQSYSSLIFEQGGTHGSYGGTDNQWENNDRLKRVTLENEKVASIDIHCFDQKYSLKGIFCGDSGEKIKNKFGNKIDIFCMKKESFSITNYKSNENSKDEDAEDTRTEFEIEDEKEREVAQNNRESGLKANATRIFFSERLGLAYYLSENQVSEISIFGSGQRKMDKDFYYICPKD